MRRQGERSENEDRRQARDQEARHRGAQSLRPLGCVDAEDPVVDTHAQDDDEADRCDHVDRDPEHAKEAECREGDEDRGQEGEQPPPQAAVAQLEDHEDDDAGQPQHAQRRAPIALV